MERRHRSGVASFYWPEPVATGAQLALEGDALRHALVRRIEVGDRVRLLSGKGSVAEGGVVDVTKSRVSVEVELVSDEPKPSVVEMLVPVADKERMLWAAEKAAEHQVTSWRPVKYARSMSVAGRGEGPKFAEKIAARTRSALEQSGGAWLPDVHADADFAEAMQLVSSIEQRIILDVSGAPMSGMIFNGPVALAVGPEGGFEASELDAALARGWTAASLGSTTLRFETAIVSAMAVIRAGQLAHRS